MRNQLMRLIPLFLILGYVMCSCSDDENNTPPAIASPSLEVNIDNVSRTSVNFTIQSSDAVDYAYIITEKDPQEEITAEYLFNEGTFGLFENDKVSISNIDIEGGKEYTLYTAVRKINPYVYSEIIETEISTNLAYTDVVTLEKIGTTDFAYHVEMPANASKMKHIVIKKADYIAIKGILATLGAISYPLYLKVFGHDLYESANFSIDKYSENALDGGIYVYSGSTYLLMAGVVRENGEIDESQFKCIEFDTRRAEESPYDFAVGITTTSTSAIVSITPDPEFVSYRVLVDTKSEYDLMRNEDESQVRSYIIGRWDDKTNSPKREHTGPVELKNLGLVPNTEYVVGIVGFDDKNREKVKTINFITSVPTGPVPTVKITEAVPSVVAPWNTAAFNVKVTNTTEVRYGFFVKTQLDQLVNSGTSLETIIKNNGVIASDQQVNGMLSKTGMTFETNSLSPSTEYVFGVYAVNNEYRTVCETATFTTDALPQVGGEVRNNMPGKYIASTTDLNGNAVTFPVTISTGVNEATSTQYSGLNRLVAIGFGPEDKYPAVMPDDLVAKGMSQADANAKYGPKWFIEFTGNKIRVPACSKSWNVLEYNGAPSYLKGYGLRYTPNGYRDMEFDDSFDVEVSEDGNTVTVKGCYHNIGDGGYCYPAMMQQSGSGWMVTTNYLFRCYSDLVLKRVADTGNKALLRKSPFVLPKIVTLTESGVKAEKTYYDQLGKLQY